MSISNNQSPPIVGRQTLESTPGRALLFLRAVGADSQIFAALAAVGFSESDIERGWGLVRSVYNARKAPVATANPVVAAMQSLETWNGPGFALAKAALRHLHPEQESFVFDGLAVGHGPEVVLSVATFLERCAALESGKGRKGTHKADLAALATLEKRGVTKAERKRLRAYVDIVEKQAAPSEPAVTPSDERDARIMALREWLLDWTDTARVVVTRRDQLIRLGIGKRRSKKDGVAPVTPADPATPAPIATPLPPAVVATPTPAPVAATPTPAVVAPAPAFTSPANGSPSKA